MNKIYFILFFIKGASLFAQEVSLKRYTPLDGLAGLQVMSTYEDSRGGIWIATKQGASYFDGKNFTNITTEDGLLHREVLSFQEADNGDVYIATSYGIAQIRNKKVVASFKHGYKHGYRDISLRPSKSKDTLFFRIHDDTLLYFPIKEKKFQKKFSLIDTSFVGYSLNFQGTLICYLDSQSFISNYFTTKEKQYIIQKYSTTIPPNFNYLGCITIFKNYKSTQDLIYYNQDTLVHYNSQYKKHYVYPFSIKKYTINSINIDSKRNIWISTEQGLIKLFATSLSFYTVSEGSPTLPWSIQEDNEGNYIIGSYNYDGVFQLKDNRFTKLSIPKKRLLFYFGASKTKKGEVVLTSHEGAFLYKNKIFKALNDSSENICPANNAQRHYFISYADTLSDEIALGSGNKFLLYDQNRVIKSYLLAQDLKPNQKKNDPSYVTNVLAIEKINPTTYLLGLSDGYLLFDTEKNKITHRSTVLPTQENTDKAIDPRTLTKDYKNTIWAGVYLSPNQNGLYRYDSATKTFKQTLEKFITKQVETIKATHGGKVLFVSQPDKLIAIHLPRYYSQENKNYLFVWDKNNGFEAIEPAQNSLMQDSKGKVWLLSGDEKIISFDFDTAYFDLPPLSLDDYKVEYFDLYQKDWKLFVDKTFCFSKNSITFSNTTRSVRFSFTSITQNAASHVVYDYRIRKKNGQWTEWQQTSDFISFSETKYGHYQMEVVPYYYYDTEGRKGKAVKTYLLYFEPHFYEVWYWQLLGAALFAILVVLASKYLESREDLRRAYKELEVTKGDLEVSLRNEKAISEENIRLKEELAHDVNNHIIKLLSYFANLKIGQIATKEGKAYFGEQQAKATKAIEVYNTKLSQGKNLTSKELKAFCERICDEYNRTDIEVALTSNLESSLGVYTEAIQNTLHELTRNAIKHAFPHHIKEPFITISIQKEKEGFVWIDYQDNGIGLPTQIREGAAGIKLLQSRAVEGTFLWENRAEGGTHLRLCLKKTT
jgi:two-component sensor histidine kinase